jgi:NAD+ kinase
LVTLDPNKEKELMDIFKGEFKKESRMLLEVNAKDQRYYAFNDCIVTRRETGRLVEIELYLDEKYMCSYRADGFLISTPTGSTAHAMSAGGPIIYPTMDAILLLPICPHKLSSRPIIIPQNGMLSIKVCDSNRVLPILGCDGQDKDVLSPGDVVHIKASAHKVQLMHGKTYDYYENLRNKLSWEEQFYQC